MYQTIMRLKTNYLFTLLFLIFLTWTTFKLLEPSIFKKWSDFQPADQQNRAVANSDLINLNELFSIGSCLLVEAGKQIVKIRSESDELKVDRKKKDNSVVTKADIESHTIIVHTLNDKYKNRLRVVSEESNSKESKNYDSKFYSSKCDTFKNKPSDSRDMLVNMKDVTVWVDPLDATQEYTENITEFVTVMFCIAYKGKPRAGIIHNPFLNLTTSSFFEKKNIDLPIANKSKNRIIVSRSHSGTVITEIQKQIEKPDLISAAGSGFKTVSLMNDKADLYFHTSKIYKWDICAPNAILNNHGGKLTERTGKKIDYFGKRGELNYVENGIIAALKNHDYFSKLFKI